MGITQEVTAYIRRNDTLNAGHLSEQVKMPLFGD